jgi:hypothetical protein
MANRDQGEAGRQFGPLNGAPVFDPVSEAGTAVLARIFIELEGLRGFW